MLLLVIVPKVKLDGCAVGVTQGVVAIAVTVILSILIFGREPVLPPVPF